MHGAFIIGDMLNRLKSFYVNTDNIERSSYVWNTASGLLFAMQSAILLMVISRTNNLDDAGVFSIAYAVASLMYYVGEFGVRKYQITDVLEKASFCDYHTHRVVTCSIVIIASLVYAGTGFLTGKYNQTKALVILLVCFMKALEAYSDVFFSRFQQQGRLDVAAKTNTFRIVESMICCIISLIITRDLLISMVVWLATAVIGLLISSILVAPDYGKIEFHLIKEKFILITRECMPLFLGNFLLLYVGNAPKYAIDEFMDDTAQACFNFIFMPVFVIGLLANFIFNPILVELAKEWEKSNYKKFRTIIIRQMFVIAGLTVLAIAVAQTIGIPVLGILFHADLTGSKTSLTILMLGGGMLALANFFTVTVTVVRGQKYLIPGYFLTAIAARLLSGYFVRTHGVLGASMLYACMMTLVSLAFGLVFVLCVKYKKKKKETAGN